MAYWKTFILVSKGCCKSGRARTRAEQRTSFNFWNALSTSGVQWRVSDCWVDLVDEQCGNNGKSISCGNMSLARNSWYLWCWWGYATPQLWNNLCELQSYQSQNLDTEQKFDQRKVSSFFPATCVGRRGPKLFKHAANVLSKFCWKPENYLGKPPQTLPGCGPTMSLMIYMKVAGALARPKAWLATHRGQTWSWKLSSINL